MTDDQKTATRQYYQSHPEVFREVIAEMDKEGKTQTEIAEATGYSQQRVSEAMSGNSSNTASGIAEKAPVDRRSKRAKIPLGDLESIRARRAAGERVEDIARTYGCDDSAVYQYLKRALKREARPNGWRDPKFIFTEAQEAQIAARYSAGEPAGTLAHAFDCSTHTIRAVAKRVDERGTPLPDRAATPPENILDFSERVRDKRGKAAAPKKPPLKPAYAVKETRRLVEEVTRIVEQIEQLPRSRRGRTRRCPGRERGRELGAERTEPLSGRAQGVPLRDGEPPPIRRRNEMVAQAVSTEWSDDDDDTAGKAQFDREGQGEEWIAEDCLEIDHSYQRRRIRDAWVKEIDTRFDPDLFLPLKVNRRRWDNDRLFVMDGQHRLLAIRRKGWDGQLLPCIVYDNLPIETEAKLFDTQGYTKALTPQERFRSALRRHRSEEVIIEEIVSKQGYGLNLDDGRGENGRITAVETLRKILRRHRSELSGDVLGVCRDGFGLDQGPKGAVLDGVTAFLVRYQKETTFDRRRLVVTLREKSMAAVLSEGMDVKKTMGTTPGDGVGFAIHRAYNRRLGQDRRLPEWSFGRSRKA